MEAGGATNTAAQRTRRSRGSITPDEILEGAFAIAERDGLDELSMPELARHLGVGVTSIYWYFRRKEDLVTAMSDEAVRISLQMLPAPATAPGWREFLREYFATLRATHQQNSVVADLILSRVGAYSRRASAATYEHFERIIAYLVGYGFAPRTAWQLLSALWNLTNGMIVSERAQRSAHAATLDKRAASLVDPIASPRIAALVASGEISLSMASDAEFEWALQVMLDGFARRLDADRKAAVRAGS